MDSVNRRPDVNIFFMICSLVYNCSYFYVHVDVVFTLAPLPRKLVRLSKQGHIRYHYCLL